MLWRAIADRVFHRIATGGLIVMIICVFWSFPDWQEVYKEDALPGLEVKDKPFPERGAVHLAIALSTFACLLGLLGIFWQHVATVVSVTSIEDTAYGMVHGKIGATSLILGWVSVALSIAGLLGVIVMLLSIRLLYLMNERD